ncbi:hypothetical protein PISMIDRAFT_272086 [Pisolithus microcarpus 441]|uniref:Uncharacterized protein n=1 Tax=Pisolithus microcarpus 441 TaxID=765257 RepID=A0A0C9ZAJ9_9AGAM|nr:hypothetical protein PISMIDRAFT_272086 [Pisolithus microcarpus 441]
MYLGIICPPRITITHASVLSWSHAASIFLPAHRMVVPSFVHVVGIMIAQDNTAPTIQLTRSLGLETSSEQHGSACKPHDILRICYET